MQVRCPSEGDCRDERREQSRIASGPIILNTKCSREKIPEELTSFYEFVDTIFHINTEITPHYAEKIEALGRCLKFFWETSFCARFPERNIAVDVFREYEDETCITVYQKRNL